jgi:hypothetical protein
MRCFFCVKKSTKVSYSVFEDGGKKGVVVVVA